jgi:O-antigen biosynthesis rhamnosyltransferase
VSLRVLHVFKTYRPDTFGGIERVIHNLCVSTKPLGIDSTVFTLSPNPPPTPVTADGYTVHAAKRNFTLRSTDISIAAFKKFAALAREVDIVHYQFPWPWMDVLHFAARHGKPSIVSYQSDIVAQRILGKVYRPLMHRFLGSMDAIVASSPDYLRTSTVLQNYRDKTSVIPIGLDESQYPEVNAARLKHYSERFTRPFFLFVGVMRYYKGLEFLIDAAPQTNADIVIVGAGDARVELEARAKSLGAGNVHFLGPVNDTDKMALMALAQGFVFPSHLRSEAFGVSLLEAAMCGLPMISCEIGTGTSFVNIHNETGLVVPPADSAALAEAMNRLISDSVLAKAFGSAARLRFEERFTAAQMAKAYVEVYRGITGQN